MADRKISQFPDGGRIQETDDLAAVRAGNNVRVQVGEAATLDIGIGAGEIPTADLLGALAFQSTVDAASVFFQPPSGGPFATDVQGAIEELAADINSLNLTAANVTYDNSISGLTAVNVQAAIDEIVADIAGLSGGKNILQYGAVGDGVTDDTAAFAAAVADGGRIYVPNGTYNLPGGVEVDNSVYFWGESTDGVIYKGDVDATEMLFRGMTQDFGWINGTMIVRMTQAMGTGQGQRGTCITLGEGYYGLTPPVPVRRCLIQNIKCLREVDSSGNYKSNQITIIGDVADVYLNNVEMSDGIGGIVCHWGGNQTGPGGTISESWHPHNIYAMNLIVNRNELAIVFSACYNSHVFNVYGEDNQGVYWVITGDAGNTWSSTEEKALICSNITCRNATFTGVTTANAVNFDGEGRYPYPLNNDDYRQIIFKNVLAENFTIQTDSIGGTICLLQDGGGVTLRNWNVICDDSDRAVYAVRWRGALIDNLNTNAYEPVYIDRTSQVKVTNCLFKDPVNTTVTGTNGAISLTGNIYSTTLGANVSAGNTTITLATGIGSVRAYRGAILRMSGTNNYAIVDQDYLSPTATSVTVRAVDWSASSGATIYLDMTCNEIEVSSNYADGYPWFVLSSSTTAGHVKGLRVIHNTTERTANRDVDMRNVDGFLIFGNRFNENGLRYASDSTQTQSIRIQTVANGSIANNYIGWNSKHLRCGIASASTDSVNVIIDGNVFGVNITDIMSGSNFDPTKGNVWGTNRLDNGDPISTTLAASLRGAEIAGVFTPAFSFATPGSPVYSTQTGTYRYRDGMLECWGQITLSNLGGASGNAGITGLPYACLNGTVNRGLLEFTTYSGFNITTGTQLRGRVNQNATTASLIYPSNSTSDNLITGAMFTNSSSVTFYCRYATATVL